MLIQISLRDGVPIYRQIVNQVKYQIASGQLTAEDELPAIRKLAQQLQVTPNTVVKAYAELEAEGVIYKRRGSGSFVATAPSPLARKEQRRIIAERIDALLAEASHMNMSLDDVIGLVRARHADLLRKMQRDEASSPPSGASHVRRSS